MNSRKKRKKRERKTEKVYRVHLPFDHSPKICNGPKSKRTKNKLKITYKKKRKMK